jgi:hypothetical protein
MMGVKVNGYRYRRCGLLLLLTILLAAGLLFPAWGARPAAADTPPSAQLLVPTGLNNPYNSSVQIAALWESPQGSLYVAYNNATLYKFDSTGNWTQLPLPAQWVSKSKWIRAIGGVSDTQIYATDRIDIQCYNGTSWSGSMTTSDNNQNLGIYSLGIACSGSGYSVFAGGQGTPKSSSASCIYQLTNPAGNVWTNMNCPTGQTGWNARVCSLWGDSPSDVFALEEGGAILYYNGTAWTMMTSLSSYQLGCVWGLSGSDVYVGNTNGVSHYNGTSWTMMPGTAGYGVSGIAGTGDDNIYALAEASNGDFVLLHYDGTAWSTYLDLTADAALNPGGGESSYAYLAMSPDGSELFAGDLQQGALAEIAGVIQAQTTAPIINSPVYAGATSVSGTSVSGAQITVYDGSTQIGTATAATTPDTNGNYDWTASLSPAPGAGDSLTATALASGEKVSVASAAVTVQAAQIQTYTVTYNGNGGTGTPPTDSNTYAAGATVTLPASVSGLVYSGYAFGGWSLTPGGAAISGTTYTMGSSNVTLYAVWTQSSATTYTVTYDANGGAGTAPTDSNTYAAGATVTVLGQGSLTAPSGDTFGGWSTAPSAGTAYQPGAKFQMGSANVTLYAVWNSGGGTESFPILSATPSFFERLN